MKKRGIRKKLVGHVLSDRMNLTCTVQVERREAHPFYHKVITRRKKFMAHNPENQARAGDQVLLEETRPLSRNKHWQVKKILRKATAELIKPEVLEEKLGGVE